MRLPCDIRCEKVLECGHRCPSLCGEDCPSTKYCVICARKNETYTKDTREQMVDFSTMKSLYELEEENEGDFPIIVLSCGHAYTMETLDGHTEFEKFYKHDSSGRRTSPLSVVELTEAGVGPFNTTHRDIVTCILCRSPVSGVKRYKRVLNLYQLSALHRKWISQASKSAAAIEKSVQALRKDIDEFICSETRESNSAIDLFRWSKRLSRQTNSFDRRIKRNCPTADLYEKETAAWKKRHSGGEPHPESVLLEPDVLPFVLTKSINLNVSFLRCRIACHIPNPFGKASSSDKKPSSSDQNANGINEEEDEKDLQLQEVADYFQKALTEYEDLLQKCDQGRYKSKYREAQGNFAANLCYVVEDLRGLGKSENHKIRSAKDLRLTCIKELQQLVGVVPELSQQYVDNLQQKEAGNFYKQVTSTERLMVFNAMASDIGSSSAHWYRCPNGHTYTIGECSRAMQRSTCPECDATIGGAGHVLAQDNSHDPNFQNFRSIL